jgi:hypothetical protein
MDVELLIIAGSQCCLATGNRVANIHPHRCRDPLTWTGEARRYRSETKAANAVPETKAADLTLYMRFARQSLCAQMSGMSV